MREITVKTTGMTCTSCERTINNALSKLDGIMEAKADYASETTRIKYDESKVDVGKIKETIEGVGYDFLGEVKEAKKEEKKGGGWKIPFFGK